MCSWVGSLQLYAVVLKVYNFLSSLKQSGQSATALTVCNSLNVPLFVLYLPLFNLLCISNKRGNFIGFMRPRKGIIPGAQLTSGSSAPTTYRMLEPGTGAQ